MHFSKLATYFQQLESTDSRLAMTGLLAKVIKESSADEVGKICYLTLGRLGPLFDNPEFNLGSKMLIRIISQAAGRSRAEVEQEYKRRGDLGDTIFALRVARRDASCSLSVLEVYSALVDIAVNEGLGSQDRKISKFSHLLGQLDPLSAKYVVRIPVGALRLGFSDLTILDALSWFICGSKEKRKEIEAAYNVYPDLEVIARAVKERGLEGLAKVKIKPGVPVLSAKAQRLNDPQAIFKKIGDSVLVEPKLDGSRAQIHLSRSRELAKAGQVIQGGLFEAAPEYRGHIRIFSRNLEDTTAMYPDIAQTIWQQIKGDEVILDGELLGYDEKTGKFLPFQQMITRKRKHGVGQAILDVPLRFFVFDILYLDGKNLLNTPLEERRRLLEKVVNAPRKKRKGIRIIEQKTLTRPDQLKKEFDQAMSRGLEGLMVKNPQGVYEAGARGFSWIKLKGELDTIDVLVMGYYVGKGKRSQFGIGAFLVGVYDPERGEYYTVAKIGTGLSDDQWRELKTRCDKVKVSDIPTEYVVVDNLYPDVWIHKEIVVVVKADEITKSPVHTAGRGMFSADKSFAGSGQVKSPKGRALGRGGEGTAQEKAGLALRFPRLVGFRDDKGVEDVTTVEELAAMFNAQKLS